MPPRRHGWRIAAPENFQSDVVLPPRLPHAGHRRPPRSAFDPAPPGLPLAFSIAVSGLAMLALVCIFWRPLGRLLEAVL